MASAGYTLEGYAEFRQTILNLTGIDLDSYRADQVQRRLLSMMRRAGIADLPTFASILADNREARRTFLDTFLINVTEWLRDPARWRDLQTVILPELLSRSSTLRIWSAGCSNGCEPYSLAMVLSEIDPEGKHHIVASDLDEDALAAAREGKYPPEMLRNLTPEQLQRHLIALPDGRFEVKPHLRRCITFERRNLLTDPAPGRFDLVLCRNVVIYFTEESKDKLYRKIVRALLPGGYLWVGSSELVMQAKELGLHLRNPFFYQLDAGTKQIT